MRRWVLNCIEIILLVIISLIFLFFVLQKTLFKGELLFGYKTYVVASDSMNPVLKKGDVIVIEDIDYDKIEIDDIITYQGLVGDVKDKVITHKVIDIFYEEDVRVLRTRGINNKIIDPNVYEEQVYGKYLCRLGLISFVNKIISDKIGFILFIVIPLGVLVILEIVNMKKEIKRKELEKLVKCQLDELKKIDNNSKEAIEIENTMCVQLEQIKNAKRDFKMMNELENNIRVPLSDIVKKIEFFKNADSKRKMDVLLLEDTDILFSSDDIRKEISKELKIRKRKQS